MLEATIDNALASSEVLMLVHPRARAELVCQIVDALIQQAPAVIADLMTASHLATEVSLIEADDQTDDDPEADPNLGTRIEDALLAEWDRAFPDRHGQEGQP